MDGVNFIGFNIKGHDPLLCRFVPNDFRISIAASELRDDWIATELGESAAVGGRSKALNSRIAGRSVEKDEGWFPVLTETGSVLPIDYGAAAEHGTEIIGCEDIAELLPMNQIGTD